MSGGTESTVLIELVENLVSLAAAAELSASTAAEAAANNSTSSADQTFIVISGELISFHQKLRFLFVFVEYVTLGAVKVFGPITRLTKVFGTSSESCYQCFSLLPAELNCSRPRSCSGLLLFSLRKAVKTVRIFMGIG